ncbi:MAG: hypothetical protein ABIE92_07270, partial [bacterium]
MNVLWNRRVAGINGSRWSCYKTLIKGKIDLPWSEFKNEVVRYNPGLITDNWIFNPDNEYILPELPESAPEENPSTKIIPGVPYFSQLDNPHTDGRFWASDPDRKDETPDG